MPRLRNIIAAAFGTCVVLLAGSLLTEQRTEADDKKGSREFRRPSHWYSRRFEGFKRLFSKEGVLFVVRRVTQETLQHGASSNSMDG